MTQVTEQTTDEVPNFTSSVDIHFRLDHVGGPDKGKPEIFQGVPNLPALDLIDFATTMEKLEEKDGLDREAMIGIIKIVLEDDSANRFIDRLGSKADPISLGQLMDVLPFLMERYGMRPPASSGPSSPSAPSPDAGTNSPPSASSQPAVTFNNSQLGTSSISST